METKSVKLINLVKQYNSKNKDSVIAVNHINIEIPEGEFVTLLGPSGCGKTTTLRMIAGFEDPTEGTIEIGTQEITSLTPDKRDTAMVFQSYALFPHYDVYNNISYGLRLKKLPEKVISEKVNKIISLVGLDELQDRFPNQMSGGQQQRVALARALVMEPSVMLFDEPLSNLDAKLRVSMRNEIKKIQRRLGVTSIYVTHDQTEAMSLSDKIIIMNSGNIEQVGTPAEIYKEPASKFVADFIGKANFVPAKATKVVGNDVTIDLWGECFNIKKNKNIDTKTGEDVTILIRPEAIEIDKDGQFNSEITMSTFMGNVQEYFVEYGGVTLTIEQTNPEFLKIKTEGKLRIKFEDKDLHIV
jgi:iron(III) transport system ATP-binding protein